MRCVWCVHDDDQHGCKRATSQVPAEIILPGLRGPSRMRASQNNLQFTILAEMSCALHKVLSRSPSTLHDNNDNHAKHGTTKQLSSTKYQHLGSDPTIFRGHPHPESPCRNTSPSNIARTTSTATSQAFIEAASALHLFSGSENL